KTGIDLGETFRQLDPSELRHDHIGDQHVDRSRVVLRDLKRLGTVLSLQYLVPFGFQELAQYGPNGRLILRQEHRFRASRCRTRDLGGFSWDYRFLHDGKVNSESSSLTRHTVYFDRASALFHNAVYGRQPEACALAN